MIWKKKALKRSYWTAGMWTHRNHLKQESPQKELLNRWEMRRPRLWRRGNFEHEWKRQIECHTQGTLGCKKIMSLDLLPSTDQWYILHIPEYLDFSELEMSQFAKRDKIAKRTAKGTVAVPVYLYRRGIRRLSKLCRWLISMKLKFEII